MLADSIIREFCAENMEHVPAACEAGARRVELCDNLAVGGTTPSTGVIKAAVAYAHQHHATVMSMVRPRGGNFEYTEMEAQIMRDDLLEAKRLGIDGVVFGCLRGGWIDEMLTADLITLAQDTHNGSDRAVQVTFHMAFDAIVPDRQLEAIDWLAEHGVSRILTHGGSAQQSITETIPRLKEYIAYAANRLIILPGGGITYDQVEELSQKLGVRELHGTKIVPLSH